MLPTVHSSRDSKQSTIEKYPPNWDTSTESLPWRQEHASTSHMNSRWTSQCLCIQRHYTFVLNHPRYPSTLTNHDLMCHFFWKLKQSLLQWLVVIVELFPNVQATVQWKQWKHLNVLWKRCRATDEHHTCTCIAERVPNQKGGALQMLDLSHIGKRKDNNSTLQ